MIGDTTDEENSLVQHKQTSCIGIALDAYEDADGLVWLSVLWQKNSVQHNENIDDISWIPEIQVRYLI